MDKLTEEEDKAHNDAENCYICEEPFMVQYSEGAMLQQSFKGWKVHDHCHFTGKYRGPAHNKCNLDLKIERRIPVVFHNLSGYDSHIIFQHLSAANGEKQKVNVIAKSMEKFISFKIGCLDFIDSANFLSTSLEKLVSNLKAKAIKENNLKGVFTTTWRYFQDKWAHLPEKAFEMLTRKGVYPYTYMDSFAKFEEQCLPPQHAYYSDLTKEHISDDEYRFAKELWSTFKLENMGQLHDLYMETDVMLLADVFETFRGVSMTNYKLDPAHFYTAPSLSWSAALKYTKVELQLMADPDQTIFIDKGLLGGISMVGNQYSKANNPELGEENYDPTKPKSYIMVLDCNNQVSYYHFSIRYL